MQVAEKERMPRLSLGEERNMVTQLLLLNITVFILLFFIRVIYQMEEYGLAAFERDILVNTRASAAPMVLLSKPWTLLTAMFTQLQFWDIFSNMVWLYCFGTLLQNAGGFRLIMPLYLYGGLAGIAFYVAGMNLFPALQPLVAGSGMMGSGAGVMALAIALLTFSPKSRVFGAVIRGGMPVWLLTALYLSIHIANVALTRGALAGGQPFYLAGGALLGFVFMTQYRRGRNWGAPVNKLIFGAGHMFHPAREKQALKEEFLEPGQATSGPAPFRKVGIVPEQKINELLDKINDQGLESLSEEEHELLLRASRDDG
ncbi:rhomboid family intramembrane serine protease [Chitinophaga lutea]